MTKEKKVMGKILSIVGMNVVPGMSGVFIQAG